MSGIAGKTVAVWVGVSIKATGLAGTVDVGMTDSSGSDGLHALKRNTARKRNRNKSRLWGNVQKKGFIFLIPWVWLQKLIMNSTDRSNPKSSYS